MELLKRVWWRSKGRTLTHPGNPPSADWVQITSAIRSGAEDRDSSPRGVTLHGGDQAKAARRLGLDWASSESGTPQITHPHTPSGRHNRTMGSPDGVGAADNVKDDPPDGGFLAWAHVFAGFIVCFNTQGLNLVPLHTVALFACLHRSQVDHRFI
ncbi:hypothetical protein VTO42DRAFT_3483 [Malbranchea cinnamomea]